VCVCVSAWGLVCVWLLCSAHVQRKMVEEFLEKLPEIDTRYEVSPTRKTFHFKLHSREEKNQKHLNISNISCFLS